jgi:coenzyme PQQ synthesis protein D (PqqD)
MNWTHAPKQIEGLEVNQLADGYIIYESNRDRVHYLNHTAVMVLEMCNGRVMAEEIPALLKRAYDLAEPPAAEVAECLARLRDEGLIR